jgi:hypothetical protein
MYFMYVQGAVCIDRKKYRMGRTSAESTGWDAWNVKNTDWDVCVPDPGKGVCADPVNRGAILEGEGPGPPSRDKERQLSPDKGRAKTGKDEKMAGGQGRLPLHCFKARACTE